MKKTVQKKKKVVRRKSVFKPRGISKVVLLCIIAVLLLGVGGFFFMNQQKGTNNTSLPFVKPVLNPNCKYNDPELCKFMNNMQTHAEFSVVSKGAAEGMTFETRMEISGEEKFHMVSKQNGKENMNTISIGDTTYTLDYSDNKWWKQTLQADSAPATSQSELKDTFSFSEKEAEDKTAYKFIAKESCDNRTCFKYQLIDPSFTESQTYIWFDDSEYLMRKMRVEGPGENSNESVYSYDKVTISEPSPVKEGTPNSWNGNLDANISDPEIQKMMQEYQNQMPVSEPETFESETSIQEEVN